MTLILGISGTGYFLVPGIGGALTVMHVPAILAGILDGPLGGAVVGLAFGIFSQFYFEPHDWLVQIPPRILIGVVAALVFMAVRRHAEGGARTSLAAVLGAMCGSLTNTIGVSLLVAMRGYYRPDEVATMALLHGTVELVMAVVVTLPIAVWAWHDRD